MLLDQLALCAPKGDGNIPNGYKEQKVRVILSIGQDGSYQGIQVLDTPKVIPLPLIGRSSNVKASPIYDNFNYMFGCGDPQKNTEKYASVRHMAYKKELVNAPAFVALTKFLANPDRPLFLPLGQPLTADQLADLEAVDLNGPFSDKADVSLGKGGQGPIEIRRAWAWVIKEARQNHIDPKTTNIVVLPVIPSTPILVAIDGLGEWWLDPAVSVLAEPKGDVVGQCGVSLTNDVTLARLIPRSGSSSLVSVNIPTANSYGLEQGYNSPMSTVMASSIANGLSALLDHGKLIQEDMHILWTQTGQPLDLLKVFGKDYDQALVGVTEDLKAQKFNYLCLGSNMGRWIVRDYEEGVDGGTIIANLTEWTTVATHQKKNGEQFITLPNHLAKAIEHASTKRAADLCRALVRFVLFRDPLPIAFHADIHRYLVDKDAINNSFESKMFQWILCGDYKNMSKATLPDPIALFKAKPNEKRAFGLGYKFFDMEQRQKRRANAPTRTLSQSHWERFLKHPRATFVQIWTLFMRDPSGKRPTMFQEKRSDASIRLTTEVSKQADKFMSFYGITADLGDPTGFQTHPDTEGVPLSFTDSDRYFAILGYEWAKAVHWAEVAERKEKKDQTESLVD